MALTIKTDRDVDKKKLHFFLDGELDLSTAQHFRETVEEEYGKQPGDIEIDFNKIEFIDSTCLGIMVSLSKFIDKEHRLCIVNMKEHIKKVFAITGLDKLFVCNGEV